MRSFFLKKKNFNDLTWTEIIEIIFSTSCKKFKIFLFIFFEKRRLTQGIRRPKAAHSPLHTSTHFFPFSSRQSFPLENATAAAFSALHEGTGKLRKICSDTIGYWKESVSSLQTLKNDILLSFTICRPQTSGHPSKYWPSTKLLDLGDRLESDIYHTEAVGYYYYYFLLILFIRQGWDKENERLKSGLD